VTSGKDGMSDQQPGGDLHVEIVDAREPVNGAVSSAAAPSAANSRSSRRRWAMRLSIASVLLLLAAALLRSASSTPPAAGTATPTPLPLGPVVLLSNVSFGSVTLNGKQLEDPPPLVMTFRPGMNVLTLAAPPFSSHTCRIDWPSAQVKAGQCETDRSGPHYTIHGQPVDPALVVTLSLGAQALPLSMQGEAGAVVAAAIASDQVSSDVPIGSFIATGRDGSGQITSQRTAMPVQATLLFTPDTSESPSSDGLCDASCATRIIPDIASALTGRIWVAALDIAVEWQFTSGGAVVARSASYIGTGVTVALTYGSARGWQVSQPATQAINGFSLSLGLDSLTVCQAGANVLSPIAQRTGYGFNETSDRGIEGCELQMQSLAGTPEGTFIWRFGVLLAVDAPAHAVAPELPMAPASEIAAVSG
jgi:hypothetical protein